MGNIVVVPTHIDTDLFRPAAHRWPDLIAATSRQSPEKNIGALIAAVAYLPWAHLWVVGDGPLHWELSSLVASIWGSRIILLGSVPNDRVAGILSQSEYFVLPSLYDQAPKSLWEAMASGCLCVVSAQVGVVEDGVTGYLCDPDPSGIRAALERARMDPRRELVRDAARKYILAAQAGSRLKTNPEEAS
ncbi:MAG TPA: hypothetical protein DCP69_09560 [Candidatus Omnitrophica bacterium]|nr:hypothetical protein [Candidatus Omnitrophota bacterium]